MLGDDNLFASDIKFDTELIKLKYAQLGLDVKVVRHDSPYTSKFL